MQKQIDKERYPLNTVAPLFRRSKMLFKIHKMQDANLEGTKMIDYEFLFLDACYAGIILCAALLIVACITMVLN